VEGNADEDTYSPMDLFDWIELISSMKDGGYTQQEIADKIGWSRSKVAQQFSLINNVVTEILAKAKEHQEGRITNNVTAVTNFTERWFRDSGLYDLNEKYQEQLMNDFIFRGLCAFE